MADPKDDYRNTPDNATPVGLRIGFIFFKMLAISTLVGLGVFLLIMGGMHPAALMRPQMFSSIPNPEAFQLAWQSGVGAGFIVFAVFWSRIR